MVALRRFFHVERGPTLDPDENGLRSECQPHNGGHYAETSQQLNVEHQFQQIEKQFEMMHDQLQARPLSSRSQALPSHASSRSTERNPRHVDLLDALFSSHRYHIHSTSTLLPITPYNEDIAERNMTQFLQVQPRKKNVYSRLLSALYQEDVADRNIRNGRRRSRSLSRMRGGSSGGHLQSNHGNIPRTEEGRIVGSTSRVASLLPPSRAERLVPPSQETTLGCGTSIRQQRSAPNLSAERTKVPRGTGPNPGDRLGVPPAYKQGNRWSNTPLPDSPTLPSTMKQDKNVNENRPTQNRSLSSSSGNRNPLISPRPGCRRNVRELSINTELAARGRPATKITHRAIQPPTPNTLETRQNLSIAEVMNSPLPLGTPTSVSPLHSDQKVSEIMDMFRQAYISSQAITPHPTFETLQDAIVREINSHEAFRRVPVPDPGPPFTPSPSEESFDGVLNVKRSPGSGSNRTVSLKDGQFSKLIRRSSFKKHTRARTSETGKSISTSVPSKAFRRASETTNRRRHTDAPPPTPGFFDTLETRPQRGTVRPEEQVTYMDLLLRSQKSSSNPGPKRYPDLGSHLDHVQRMSTASPDMSERSIPAPSVLHMRAQTSVSSGDSRTSFSAYESDEEVIQLPSVGVPFVQIQCVDEHNLSHVAENATSRNAYRLMNWPRKSNRSISLRGNAIKNGSSPSQPTPRIERWVRGMRSVESY